MEDKEVLPRIERMDYLVSKVSIDFHRYLLDKIRWKNRLVGIKGSRGTGKTTLLRQHVRESFGGVGEKALYVSLDDLWFSRNSLIDLADWHRKRGGTHLFIDEVHYLKPWQTYIKNLTDFFPDLSVGYTGSSTLKNILRLRESRISRHSDLTISCAATGRLHVRLRMASAS